MQNLYNLDNVRPWLKAARAHARDECSSDGEAYPFHGLHWHSTQEMEKNGENG